MVQIITDSAADLEPQELKEKNIVCISMQISFADKTYKENENLTKSQFYTLLKDSEVFPKTSQPTPYDFEDILKEFQAKGDECVIITISSALSGTSQSALLVRDMLSYKDCFVVDSLSATGGERFLVDYAVKLRDEGKGAKEIADALEHLKKSIRLFACVDTLEYLHRGGRLSKTAYTVGTIANIKPIIRLSEEGKVEVVSKALSMKKAIGSICKELTVHKPDTSYPIYVLYSDIRKNGELLFEAIANLGYEIAPQNIVNIGATIGAHVGAGACGVVYAAESAR